MIRSSLSKALRIEPASKPKLYRQIFDSAEIGSASYLLEIAFAAAIATLGLVLNSPAVVIGAMLISPLMGPILAAGLAFAAADIYLGVKAFVCLVGSIALAVLFSAALVWLLPFQSPTTEILARTQPNLLDLGVAVFSGLAGSVVMSRSLSGGAASALPGVAIAVALMPPLCTVGFGIGSGWNRQIMSGAALLFLTNLVAIAGSAFFVFYLVGMDADEVRSCISEDEMRHATGAPLYRLFHKAFLGSVFGGVGQLRWRIGMVIVTFAVLFVPLRKSLLQLRDETLSRTAAREAILSLVPADHLLSQRLEILPDRIIQNLITTTPVDETHIRATEAELARKVRKTVSIQVRQVANEEELITLRERLKAPELPPAPPPPPSLKAMAAAVLPLVERPIKAIWPSTAASLIGYEIGLSKEGVVLHLAYQSPRALDTATQETIRNALKNSAVLENVATEFDWRGVAKVAPTQRKQTPSAQVKAGSS